MAAEVAEKIISKLSLRAEEEEEEEVKGGVRGVRVTEKGMS